MKRFLVTPWNGAEWCLTGWDRATEGSFSMRMVVWNGPHEPFEFPEDVHVVRVPESITGFGAITSYGIEEFTHWSNDGDEIWVLNNDIEGSFLPEAIPPGCMYGPQFVSTGQVVNPKTRARAGMAKEGLPDICYLDGWAVGAHVETWAKFQETFGSAMPIMKGYYWEDPALALYCNHHGILQCSYPTGLKHLGGRTTALRPEIGEEFEVNRKAFASMLAERLGIQ